MSIKNVKPTRKSNFFQGYYKPKNIEKYIGPTPIIYRSSWEYKFCIWCDENQKVLNWSSEPIEIKYLFRKDNKAHRYFPDFYFKQLKVDQSIVEYLVEIKPKPQIQKPKPPKRNSKKALASYKFLAEEYIKNMDKYNAARQYCKNRNWQFIVLTEDTIANGLR